MTESTTTRLHITPLNPDLLPSVLPPSVRPSATDISFHSLSTFPENNYGYITLPTMEAEKIQKKLNGKILKGKKFRIETARPSKRQRDEDEEAVAEAEADAPAEKKKSSKKSSKDPSKKSKAKDEDGIIEGYELPSDRKVKRGWTESSKKEKHRSEKKKSKDDKKEKPQPKSKYSDKSEMLFRTNLPPNRASNEAEDKKAKKKKKASRETVVHEFEKTYTQPSFLRSSGEDAKPSTEFDEEKGWVDAEGAVKESASKKSRKDNYRPGQIPGTKEKKPKKVVVPEPEPESPSSSESEDYTSSSGSSDEDSDSDSDSDNDSSDDSSDDSAVEEEVPEDQGSDKQTGSGKATPPTSDDSESESEEPASKPAVETKAKETASEEIHPLEALFKKPAPTAEDQPAEDTNAGFSFFGNGDIESEDESHTAELQAPVTPFTKRDLQDRGLRSAAPTPDTTMINRRMKWDEDEEMEDEVSIDTPVSKPRGKDADAKDETEFQKWFWDNRGDNNRAWKKRRRDAAKEQRQRENRRKGMKGRS